MAQGNQDRPQAATRDAGTEAARQAVTEPSRPAPTSGSPNGMSHAEGETQAQTQGQTQQANAKAGVVAPSEEELRRAKDVLARAKQTGVKLSPGGGGQARIMLPTGESRSAYIKRRWKEGVGRSQILKEIQSAGGEHANCTYQIVFAATKGEPGGPNKEAGGDGGNEKYSLVPPGNQSTATQANQTSAAE